MAGPPGGPLGTLTVTVTLGGGAATFAGEGGGFGTGERALASGEVAIVKLVVIMGAGITGAVAVVVTDVVVIVTVTVAAVLGEDGGGGDLGGVSELEAAAAMALLKSIVRVGPTLEQVPEDGHEGTVREPPGDPEVESLGLLGGGGTFFSGLGGGRLECWSFSTPAMASSA